MSDGWRSVRVPASSANLGPGFDALGLALGVYLECKFRPAKALTIRATGCDAELISTGEDNLIWQTAVKCGGPSPSNCSSTMAFRSEKGSDRAQRLLWPVW